MDMKRGYRESAIALGFVVVGLIVWDITRDRNLTAATLLIGVLLAIIIYRVTEKEYRELAIDLGVLAAGLIVWWITRDWSLVAATLWIGVLLGIIISWVIERRGRD